MAIKSNIKPPITQTKAVRRKPSLEKIKAAKEHIADIKVLNKKLAREKAEFKRLQQTLEAYEDLRDDVISHVRNSGVSFETIHEKGGPTPRTLQSWTDKSVHQPRLGKMRSTLLVIGKDIGIIDRAPRLVKSP